MDAVRSAAAHFQARRHFSAAAVMLGAKFTRISAQGLLKPGQPGQDDSYKQWRSMWISGTGAIDDERGFSSIAHTREKDHSGVQSTPRILRVGISERRRWTPLLCLNAYLKGMDAARCRDLRFSLPTSSHHTLLSPTSVPRQENHHWV